MAKILFCDFFGVLVTDSGNRFLNELGLSHLKNEVFPDADIGNIDEDKLFIRLEKISGINKNKIYHTFEDYAHLIDSTVLSLKEVKKKYKIIIISNAYDGVVERRIKQFHLEELFDDILVSYMIHRVKPNKEIYEYAINKYASEGDEIFYLDDNEINLIEPSKLGFKTVLFKEGMDILKTLDNFS